MLEQAAAEAVQTGMLWMTHLVTPALGALLSSSARDLFGYHAPPSVQHSMCDHQFDNGSDCAVACRSYWYALGAFSPAVKVVLLPKHGTAGYGVALTCCHICLAILPRARPLVRSSILS